MTARTPRRKPTARERVLAYLDGMAAERFGGSLLKYHKAKKRRLLRAHEHELAERADAAIDFAVSQAECPSDCPCRASVNALRHPIRAAILGRKGGKR